MTVVLRSARSVFAPASLAVWLVAVGCWFVPATAALAAEKPAPAAPRDPRAEFLEAHASVRTDGRRAVDDLLEAYSRLSVMQMPGVSALRIDLLRMSEQMRRERRAHFSPEEVDGLTLRNPDFWQAWFEFNPQDNSLLMLYAALLLDAGATHRASAVLTLGVQALPQSSHERMLWLQQQVRANWVLFKRLNDLEARQKTWRKNDAARIAGYETALRDWPDDAFALEGLLQAKAGVKAERAASGDSPITLAPPVREKVADELARLERLSPSAAIRYAKDAALVEKFNRLWSDLTDEERPADERQIAQLAEVCAKLGEPELRVLLVRIGAARRGFYSPADFAAISESCASLLTESEFKDLSAALENRQGPGALLTTAPEKPEEILPGLDPAVHPAYAEQAVRECARETFWIEASGDSVEMRASHLWQRSVRLSNVGCTAAALVDLDAALALQPKRVEWLVDRAGLLLRLGRTAEAEDAFAAARKLEPKNEHLRSSLAIARFGQGKFAEAEQLYRAADRRDPNLSYAVLMAHLAGVRRGAADLAPVKKQLAAAGPKWPAAILRHLLGQIDRRALLDAAQDDSELRTTEQQCEAFFTLGQLALARGDIAGAKLELENCEHAGIVGFIEYGLAQQELDKLDPSRVERRRAAQAAPAAKPATPEEKARQDERI